MSLLYSACHNVITYQCISLMLRDEHAYNTINYITVFISHFLQLLHVMNRVLFLVPKTSSVIEIICTCIPHSSLFQGAGEMAQSSTCCSCRGPRFGFTWQLTTIFYSSARASGALFWHPWVLHTRRIYIYPYTYIHTK